MKWGLGAALVLYMAYAALMVLLHPRFIYPCSAEPFVHPSYQRQDLPNGPTVYVYDAGAGAPLVVYFMGNVGALGPFLPMLDHHRAAGRSVLAMGYRGGGACRASPPKPLSRPTRLSPSTLRRGLYPTQVQ